LHRENTAGFDSLTLHHIKVMRQLFRQFLFLLLLLSLGLEVLVTFATQPDYRMWLMLSEFALLAVIVVAIVRGKVFTRRGNWRWIPNEDEAAWREFQTSQKSQGNSDTGS